MRATKTLVVAALALACQTAQAQSTVTYEDGPNGTKYRVTRTVTQQLAPVTEMQSREEKVFHPRTTTAYQSYQQSYLTPVTEYRWVSRMRGRWNPFVQPYWSQQLEPFTRWENRVSTVQRPTTKTEWVEERRIVQVPVTSYRTVQNESISKVAVNTVPPAVPNYSAPNTFTPVETPMVASRPSSVVGGQRMQSDPPRAGAGWQSQDGTLRR